MTTTYRSLFASEHGLLATGVLVLELGAALSVYVTAVVLPRSMSDLAAADAYPVMVSAVSVGGLLALAVARPLLQRVGTARLLVLGLVLTVAGMLLTATAAGAIAFGAGRSLSALGAGLLGVLGLSAVIDRLPIAHRTRLLALISSMWLLPGVLGPPLALLAESALGWRVAMLLPLPVVLVGRLLVGRSLLRGPGRSPDQIDRAPTRWGATLALPAGMAVFVTGSTLGSWWGWTGLLLTLVAGLRLLPPGTTRASRGHPQHLGGLLLLAAGYFGAQGLLTLSTVRADGLALVWGNTALGASSVLWALASLLVPTLVGPAGERRPLVLRSGLVLMLLALTTWSALQLTQTLTGPLVLLLWCTVGVGMGLAYPLLYVGATVPGTGAPGSVLPAGATLAAAVLLAEQLGIDVGTAVGSGIVDLALSLGLGETGGLHLSSIAFVGLVGLALLTTRPVGVDRS